MKNAVGDTLSVSSLLFCAIASPTSGVTYESPVWVCRMPEFPAISGDGWGGGEEGTRAARSVVHPRTCGAANENEEVTYERKIDDYN